jgi:hypothetical protein
MPRLARLDDSGVRLLGLARRAGALIPGMDRIRPLAEAGKRVLVLADPGLSERSRRELDRWQEASSQCEVYLIEAFVERVSALDLKGLRAVGLSEEGFQQGLTARLKIINTGE